MYRPFFRKILNYIEKKDPISSLIESIIHLTVTFIPLIKFGIPKSIIPFSRANNLRTLPSRLHKKKRKIALKIFNWKEIFKFFDYEK